MIRPTLSLIPLPFLAACSLVTDVSSDRNVEVTVDPVVQQRVASITTGTAYNQPFVDPADIPCNVGTPRTCYTSEFVQVTVRNEGTAPISYRWSCPPPFQRRLEGEWRPFSTFSTCTLQLLLSTIQPGESAVFPLSLVNAQSYVWRTSGDELRVVLELSDAEGDLPERMRTSAPFYVRLQ